MFVNVHLSDHYGTPIHPVENGFYHIKNSSKETAINYLRITEAEYDSLYQAEDKQHFKHLLFSFGIVERWKRESNEALKKLEELTGQIWEKPFTLKLTDEERTSITNSNGGRFNKFFSSVDRSLLPDGITIKMK